MNKKIIITIGVILGLAIIAGGFLVLQKTKKQEEMAKNEQEVEVVENDENGSKKKNETNNQKKKEEIEKGEIGYDFHTHLTKQEIEKLKKEKDLVWYEIPELGIKFLVTEDMKEDLKYNIKNTRKKSEVYGEKVITMAYIYKQSVIDFLDHEWCFNNKNENLCTDGVLSRYSVELNELYKKHNDTESMFKVCQSSSVIANINNDIVCFTGPQAWNFESRDQYKEYLKTIKSKNLEIYLGTTESISNK